MRRVMIIGLDGAEPSLVEPWMDAGILPALAQLRDTGSYFRCASTIPPATFPAWTTCVTGVNPGKHRLFDFTELVPGTYSLRFLNASFRGAPALWQILSAAGKRVGILGVPGTYPPEPVNGVMVSGFDTPVTTHIDRSFVYPKTFYPLARRWVFADFQESYISARWHEQALPKLLKAIDEKSSIVHELLENDSWDFFMVVFGESDTVAHHFWLFHDERSPRHIPDPRFRHAIQDVYQKLDAAVGKILQKVGPDTLVIVVSDHGFGGAGDGILYLNNFLADHAVLKFLPAAIGSNVMKRLALQYVPASWQGKLFRKFQGVAERMESRSRFGAIDWNATRAWSEELNYFPSVRINLKGREPNGQVDPHDYELFRNDLIALLESWRPIRKAWRREELYEGPFVEYAPDILLELQLESGYSYSCLRSRPGGPCLRRITPEERLGGKEQGMNGSHRPTGVLFLSERVAETCARLADVAPTVLAALGIATPPMDGKSLLGNSPDHQKNFCAPSPIDYTPEQERIIEERLRALGYLE